MRLWLIILAGWIALACVSPYAAGYHLPTFIVGGVVLDVLLRRRRKAHGSSSSSSKDC